jgi:hypothetical protein
MKKYYVVGSISDNEIVRANHSPKNAICEIDESLVGKSYKIEDIIEETEVDKVVLDGEGNPVMIQALDGEGNPMMHQPLDIYGNPDGDPQPVMIPQVELDGEGNPVKEIIQEVIGKQAVLDQAAEDIRIAQEAADIATEALAQAKRNAGASRRALRDKVEDEILAINAVALNSTAEVEAYLNDPVIESLNKLIQGLSFGTALEKLQSSDLSAYYTAEQKQTLEDLLSDGIANL